jgi:hypothetical protein
MSFIDTNLNQSWIVQQLPSIGITRNSQPGLRYIDNRTNTPSGYNYSQGKNYQVITKVLNSKIGSNLYIRFNAPFKDSLASITRSINANSIEFYTYATPLSTSTSTSIVRYGATESFTQSLITQSNLNEIDFLINGYREFSYLDNRGIDNITQPSGWYFDDNSYKWSYSSTSISPSYSIFGSGLDTIVTKNFIAKPIEYDTFSLELKYTHTQFTNVADGMSIYLIKNSLLKTPSLWGPPLIDFKSTTIFATNSLIGTNTDGTKNYLVITATQSNTYVGDISNISIVGAYHPDNNRLQLTTNSTNYLNPTTLGVSMSSATYSHVLMQNGNPYILSSKIGNGLFKLGIWENGVWNSGWRDDTNASDFDDVAFSVLTDSDVSWKIELRGSTYSIANFETGSAVSIGNIVAIDINDNRRILKDYYKIENLGIGYEYSPSGETQSAYGWMRINLDTTFPYRRIEKDSQNHKIKVTRNIWLSGGFFNGYFSGVWNNGLFKGLPLLTEMFNTHWIDGFFNGGHFTSIYSKVYNFSKLGPRKSCTNGYINLTFDQYTPFLPGDYIIITLLNGVGIKVDSEYAGIAKIITIDHQTLTNGDKQDVITIDKIFNGNSIIIDSNITILGSVVRYTATSLMQNVKFYDNNRSKVKSTDSQVSSVVFSFNSWIDVNYDNTRSVTLGKDFRMYEPLTKKSINRTNLYGYPTYDVLSSISRFRDSNTLDYKLYKLGTKYKVFTDFIGEGSGFNEPFNELDFSNFTNVGWTYSYNSISNFDLKRTETLISLNNLESTNFLNSGVTGDELFVSANNTGLVLNNDNVNILKSRYSVVEFDVLTHSVTSYNFDYKNPDIYIEKSIDSSGLTFSESISSSSIISTYSVTGPTGITADDIIVMVDLYGEVPSTIINLVAPNGTIINLKRLGSGLGIRMSKTKFSLRDIYTKFSLITTPYNLNNTTISYEDTYSMDREIGQGDTPYISNITSLSDLTTSLYGIWTLYIRYNPIGVTSFDLTNWSISIQYKDLVSVDTEPISSFPVLNFSNLNYDITTQLSGYDNVQVYKRMNYLPIKDNINHLRVSNTFRLDSVEDSSPVKWGGFGKNQPTKKYEYFYNKTDMMLNITGNGATGASASEVVLDNLNMYEVDMIPFFKYFDDVNIYKGIQIPYIGEAPNIDYLNSDFIFIDNITIGLDSINSVAISAAISCVDTSLIVTTSSATLTTSTPGPITQTSARVGGSILLTGNLTFITGGVYISTNPTPGNTTLLLTTLVYNGNLFGNVINGLLPNTTYYTFSFVTYQNQVTSVNTTEYGPVIEFKTLPMAPDYSPTDYSGDYSH